MTNCSFIDNRQSQSMTEKKGKKTSSAAVKINPFILYNTYAPNFEVKTINSGERSPSNGPFSLNIYVIKVSEKWNEWTDQSNEFVRVIQGCEFIYNVVIKSKRGVKYWSKGCEVFESWALRFGNVSLLILLFRKNPSELAVQSHEFVYGIQSNQFF